MILLFQNWDSVSTI